MAKKKPNRNSVEDNNGIEAGNKEEEIGNGWKHVGMEKRVKQIWAR